MEWNIDTQASTGMAPDVDELQLYFGSRPLRRRRGRKVFSTFTDDATVPMQASASSANAKRCRWSAPSR